MYLVFDNLVSLFPVSSAGYPDGADGSKMVAYVDGGQQALTSGQSMDGVSGVLYGSNEINVTVEPVTVDGQQVSYPYPPSTQDA